MKKRFIALMMVLLALCAGTLACGKKEEARQEKNDSNVLRIYDVEPQEEGECKADQHYLRVGVLNDISDDTNINAPFANQIEKIKEETGAEIEYLVFDNWDELLAAEKEFEDAKVTEMILFNNTFNGSIVKEVSSGRYADMEAALTEYGFYEEEAYNQLVLGAGVIGNQQALVPILYNVSGMIQGENERYSYEEWKEMAYDHAESANIDFEDFVAMLTKEMVQANVDEMDLPFMSTGFLEEKVDLFLMASGVRMDSFEQQQELFSVLYNYLNTYQQEQVDSTGEKRSNQMLYGEYLAAYQNSPSEVYESQTGMSMLPAEDVDELKLESITYSEGDEPLFILVSSMLNRTEYFVECSTAESIAFHSVFGLLGYGSHYAAASNNGQMGSDFAITSVGNMNYWPIGVWGSENEYAAQPICYAAVVDGGSTRLAARVLQSMMNQPVDAKYGISTCNASMKQQLEQWKQEEDRMGNVRSYTIDAQGQMCAKLRKAYWGNIMGSKNDLFLEDKEIYASQIQNQIDHIVSAEIPDREILSIWQDTLTESVESGLSPQVGFELLCERMDAWYK